MKPTASRTVPLDEITVWQADKRLLPSYLCTSDNTRRIQYYKKALRDALSTRLTDIQREQLLLHYVKRISKTEIGKRYGVGSSTVCKTIKAAQNAIREYVELYMQIYDLLEHESFEQDDEYGETQGG